MPYYSKPKRTGSIRWFYTSLAIIALGILYWSYVMHPVEAEVQALPLTLEPDGTSYTEIRVVLLNRLGGEVPWQHTALKCEALEGHDLVQISYTDDSSRARITARDREGVAEIKVSSPDLFFPQSVKIHIERPRA